VKKSKNTCRQFRSAWKILLALFLNYFRHHPSYSKINKIYYVFYYDLFYNKIKTWLIVLYIWTKNFNKTNGKIYQKNQQWKQFKNGLEGVHQCGELTSQSILYRRSQCLAPHCYRRQRTGIITSREQHQRSSRAHVCVAASSVVVGSAVALAAAQQGNNRAAWIDLEFSPRVGAPPSPWLCANHQVARNRQPVISHVH
jgi:hypothetical protein